MKKKLLLFILILLIPVVAWASGRVVFMSPGASTCTSCSGGILFAAYFEENENLDIEEGEPCGCAAGGGDHVWTANDSCVIVEGANGYVDSSTFAKYVAFDISSDDIFEDSEGSLIVKIKINTFDSGGKIFYVYKDYNHSLSLEYYGVDDLLLNYYNTSMYANEVFCNFVNSETYYIICRWKVDAGDDLEVGVYDSDKSEITTVATDTDLVAMGENAPTVLTVGNFDPDDAADTHIYGIIIYDSYDGANISNSEVNNL